jgi:uncharacterized protein
MARENVEFEWDEEKRLQNIAKHNIDFFRAALAFNGRPAVVNFSPRIAEERWQTIAEIDGRVITVIWTWRGRRCRIISARKARNAERRAYRQILA